MTLIRSPAADKAIFPDFNSKASSPKTSFLQPFKAKTFALSFSAIASRSAVLAINFWATLLSSDLCFNKTFSNSINAGFCGFDLFSF